MQILSHSPLSSLRTAYASLRGMEFLGSFKPESHVTQTQWAAYLERLYTGIYHQISTGSQMVLAEGHQPVDATDNAIASHLLSVRFTHFSRLFFDGNGFYRVTTAQEAAEGLGWLYRELATLHPQPALHPLALRIFFTALGQMRGFREKLGGIDFRRLTGEEVESLQKENATLAEISAAFLAAMRPDRNPVYPSTLPPYPYWPDCSVMIEGYRFLALPADSPRIRWCKTEASVIPLPPAGGVRGGCQTATEYPHPSPPPQAGEGVREESILLANGRIVLRSRFVALLKDYLRQGKLLGAWRIPEQEWAGMLEALPDYFANAPQIDTEDVTQAAPPLCLSLHAMTHLTHAEHQQMDGTLKAQGYPNGIQALQQPEIAEAILAKTQDASLREAITLAAGRLQRIATTMQGLVHREIQQNAAALCAEGETPHFLMTMGGSGSGKNSNRFYREQVAKRHYLYASLDDSRSGNDIFHVLIAAGHHADDYEAVHLWADMRRNALCEAALKARMNLIYDGSGIPYQGRYDTIVRRFAEAGYHTAVIAADCMLVLPESRRSTFPSSAIDRILARAGKATEHYRTLPWRVAINKHIGFPASLLAAAHDPHLHQLMLVDNAGAAGQETLLAETKETNGQRELYVYHPLRMAEVLEKAQLNPNAHSPQALTWLKSGASFLMGLDQWVMP